MTTLYAHQQKIIDEDKHYAGLFLGTGSGKSLTALMLSRGNTLVIAPKTQIEDGNWLRETKKMQGAGHWSIKDDVWVRSPFTLTTISKETFRRDWEKLPHYDTVIVDEAHTVLGVTPNIRYRNKQAIPKTSQLFDALDRYIKGTKPKRLYLCTATIIKNPMTVWGAAKLLGFTWNFYSFRDTFYVRLPIPGREIFATKSDKGSKDRLAKAVRKIGYTGQLSDYFDVPDQTYKTIHVGLSKEQTDRIKEVKIEYPDPLVQLGKIHQIENGVLAGDEFSEQEYFDNEKLDKIKELALEFPKMIVFAKYTAQVKQIGNSFYDSEINRRIFYLTGDTKDRGALIAEANKCERYVFICQAQISAGWELPDCPVMVFASLDWSIVSYIQAQGRILRANALKKNLYIHLVVKGGVDEKVYKAIMNKKDFNLAIYEKNNL